MMLARFIVGAAISGLLTPVHAQTAPPGYSGHHDIVRHMPTGDGTLDEAVRACDAHLAKPPATGFASGWEDCPAIMAKWQAKFDAVKNADTAATEAKQHAAVTKAIGQ